MPLADEARWVLDAIRDAGIPEYCDLTPQEARAAHEARANKLAPPKRDIYRVENRDLPGPDGGIPIRIYTPLKFDTPAPVLTWLHGGGHVIGSLDSYDRLCRELSAKAGCVLVSVDYRLAPEHKFPAAVDDCFAALRWVGKEASAQGWDPARIAIGGDSAGGNLAAVCAIMARDAGGPALRFQLLIYPATAPYPDSESQFEFADGYLLTRRVILWFHNHYLRQESDRRDYRYAPLIAPDLSRLPPTKIIVAECDPLRDEGIEYAERLCAAGNDVSLSCYPGMIHPFFSMSGALAAAREAVDEAADALRHGLVLTGAEGEAERRNAVS